MKNISRRVTAAQARAAFLKEFQFECRTHGLTAHYSSSAGCIACAAVSGAKKTQRLRNDPEARAARNAVDRASDAKRMQDPAHRQAHNAYTKALRAGNSVYRGKQREARAARDWMNVTGGNLPASYGSEKESLQRFYASVPTGSHADHLCPKVSKDFSGEPVACGLHTLRNLAVIPAELNRRKRSYFDPSNFRAQRPANAFPGGEFDPTLTEEEWSRVELLVKRYGADKETTIRAIQAQIARQHAIAMAA